MTYKELKHKIKEEQKSLAQKIKEQKGQRKGSPDGYVLGLDYNRDDYRHTHIAYCMYFNQTPYKKIELTCQDTPRWYRIDKLKENWENQIDEALRNCA